MVAGKFPHWRCLRGPWEKENPPGALKNEASSLFICVSYRSLMGPQNLCTLFSFVAVATKWVVGSFQGPAQRIGSARPGCSGFSYIFSGLRRAYNKRDNGSVGVSAPPASSLLIQSSSPVRLLPELLTSVYLRQSGLMTHQRLARKQMCPGAVHARCWVCVWVHLFAMSPQGALNAPLLAWRLSSFFLLLLRPLPVEKWCLKAKPHCVCAVYRLTYDTTASIVNISHNLTCAGTNNHWPNGFKWHQVI